MTQINTDRRVRRSKRLLQEALLELMRGQELADITVTNIVTHADYNRSTFYRHYNHKEQLADDIITDQLTQLMNVFKNPYKNGKYIYLHNLSPDDIQIFNHIYEHRTFYSLWYKFTKLPGFKDVFLDSLIRLFKDDIALVSPDTDLDDRLYTSFYANGILGIIIDWIESGLEKSPAYMANQFVKILNYYPGVSYMHDT